MKHHMIHPSALALALASATAIAAPGDQLTSTSVLSVDALATVFGGTQAVAMGPDGRAIVVWKAPRYGEATLYTQRFDAHGNALGFPNALDQNITGGAVSGEIAVSVDHNGIAILVWQSALTQDDGDIRMLRIGSDGFPIGPAVVVNTDVIGTQSLPSVASDSLNHVLITWTGPAPEGGYALYGQFYNAYGSQQFTQFRIDQTAALAPLRSIAVAGECCTPVVIWQEEGSLPFEKTLRARTLGLSGQAWGDAAVVNQQPSLSNEEIRVVADMDHERNITVAWVDDGGMWTQRIDNYLNPIGPQSPINTALPISADAALFLQSGVQGRGMLAWSDTDSMPNRGVLQLLNGDGADGAAIEVLTSDTAFAKRIAGLAADQDGDVGMVWLSGEYPGATQQNFSFARFEGSSDVAATVALRSPEVVAPGATFALDIEALNLAAPMPFSPAINTLTGVRVTIDLDDRLSLMQDPSTPDWQCQPGDPLVCTRTALIEPSWWTASNTIALAVVAPDKRATLVNSAVITTLQGDSNPFDNSATQTIEVGDAEPDAYVFQTRVNVPRSSEQISEEVVLSGFDVAQTLTVSGGEYSLNGNAFSTVPATVQAGDRLRLRHVASGEFNRRVNTYVYIGASEGGFTTQTEERDTTPDAFTFFDAVNVPRGSLQISNAILLKGINDAAPISVAGGEYSVGDGAFTATPGTVTAGSVVRLRHAAAAGFASSVATTLSIGGVSAVFTSTTEAMDTTPDAFNFIDLSGLATRVEALSAPITVSGINAPASIGITSGTYSINAGPFTALAGTVVNGDQVRIAVTTASNANSPVAATLSIGRVEDRFTAVTGAVDTTPEAFTFSDQTGVRFGRAITSNTIALSSINAPVAISISGTTAQYSKNGGAFTASPGTVSKGDQIRLRLTSADTANTTRIATITMGGISDEWRVTTGNR